MKLLRFFIIIYHFIYVNCENGIKERKKDIIITQKQGNMPFFRRQIESKPDHVEGTESGSSANVASIIMEHLKYLFDDNNTLEENVNDITTRITVTEATNLATNTHEYHLKEARHKTRTDNYYLNFAKTVQRHVMPARRLDQAKKLKEKFEEAYSIVIENATKKIGEVLHENETDFKISEKRRSCIICDSVIMERCHDPRKKVVPSILCERENDICYVQHTPFGIIDRGCFNVDHNLTTHVCSCNLCNYISISEMPYIFTNKRDWVDNVAEISRTRNLRKSVFKDMACLRCEVNSADKNASLDEKSKCLDGSALHIPKETCKENEICGVIAKKNEGYIWRGCLKSPLYNYWFDFCETDLCNYQPLEPIYSYIQTYNS